MWLYPFLCIWTAAVFITYILSPAICDSLAHMFLFILSSSRSIYYLSALNFSSSIIFLSCSFITFSAFITIYLGFLWLTSAICIALEMPLFVNYQFFAEVLAIWKVPFLKKAASMHLTLLFSFLEPYSNILKWSFASLKLPIFVYRLQVPFWPFVIPHFIYSSIYSFRSFPF